MLGQEFYRSSYRNMVNTVEQRDPQTGYKTRIMNSNGHPVSKYAVNREELPIKSQDGKVTHFKKVKATRSFLRCEILLQPTLTQYSFAVLQNVSANNGVGNPGTNPTEQRLKLQDVFFCNRLGFYIYFATTNGGSIQYRYILFTNSAATLFASGGVDPIQMYALWTTGTLQVTVNNDILTPAWDMLQHLYYPMFQGDPTGAPGGYTTAFLTGLDGSKDGFVTVEPNWVLNGGNDNEYVITYPQSLNTMGLTGTAKVYLVLKLEGFLVQNVSSIMDNK